MREMSTYDLVIRNGLLLTIAGTQTGDIAVENGAIVELGNTIGASGAVEVDASGLHVFPGGVDPHVHFQDPGNSSWEGFATGTEALAAGGMTLVFDMPLDCLPTTIDAASVDVKLAAVSSSALVDFALWGGLVPGNLDQLEELA